MLRNTLGTSVHYRSPTVLLQLLKLLHDVLQVLDHGLKSWIRPQKTVLSSLQDGQAILQRGGGAALKSDAGLFVGRNLQVHTPFPPGILSEVLFAAS